MSVPDKKRQASHDRRRTHKRQKAVATNLGNCAFCDENIKVENLLSDSGNRGHETTYQCVLNCSISKLWV